MARKSKKHQQPTDVIPELKTRLVPLPLAKTENQKLFINAVLKKEMVLATGSAGTGKSYLSATLGAYLFSLGKIDTIVITRPTVATGKSIGFFPGTLQEKMQPWVAPFLSVLEDCLTKGKVEYMLKKGQIQIVPFEVIRGSTFNDALVVLDEAQNCTTLEIKAFVTRHGENCTTIINGDTTQSDLNGAGNGLDHILGMIKNNKDLQEQVVVVEFTSEDIVRSGLCKTWVQAFERTTLK